MHDVELFNELLREHISRLHVLYKTMVACVVCGQDGELDAAVVAFEQELDVAIERATSDVAPVFEEAGNDYYH